MTSRNINNSQRFIVKTRYPTTSLAAYSVCGKPGSAEKKKTKVNKKAGGGGGRERDISMNVVSGNIYTNRSQPSCCRSLCPILS